MFLALLAMLLYSLPSFADENVLSRIFQKVGGLTIPGCYNSQCLFQPTKADRPALYLETALIALLE
jgi:hypothetical protein